MKTGMELIKKERREQIYKHRFSLKRDAEFYKNGELIQAAKHTLEKIGKGPGFKSIKYPFPDGWDVYFARTIRMKSDIEKLIVAGAFYMAERDRRKNTDFTMRILQIAKRIDQLQSIES